MTSNAQVSRAPIRAVIFDVGGVLVRTEDRRPREAWERRLGLGPGELERLVFGCQASRQASLGLAPTEAVWQEVARTLRLGREAGDALRADFFAGDRLDHDLLAFIRRQRPALKTALLTNAWPDARAWLQETWHLAEAFDVIIASSEVGLLKPDPRIYRLALERLGVAPAEAVFVDDFEENVAGARAVGLRAIRFSSRDQVLAELRSLVDADRPG